METFNDKFVEQAQRNILIHMEKIAYFRSDSQEQDRGKFIYSNKPSIIINYHH